jgi:hypothetical protein
MPYKSGFHPHELKHKSWLWRTPREALDLRQVTASKRPLDCSFATCRMGALDLPTQPQTFVRGVLHALTVKTRILSISPVPYLLQQISSESWAGYRERRWYEVHTYHDSMWWLFIKHHEKQQLSPWVSPQFCPAWHIVTLEKDGKGVMMIPEHALTCKPINLLKIDTLW